MQHFGTKTVGDWVVEHPQTSRVFEQLQIDYCCGGGKQLEQACQDRGIDFAQVCERLEQAIHEQCAVNEFPADSSLTDLCHQIVQTHHAFLRRELPRLAEMVAKVARRHGNSHPELQTIQHVFTELRNELEPHMSKEEHVLFPSIVQLEQSPGLPSFPFGGIENPIGAMMHEHDAAGTALAQLRELTNGYEPSSEACNTWRAMLDGLRELESNMHQHIHKENNILFPRAKKLADLKGLAQ